MILQNRGRHEVADLAFERAFDGLCLAVVGYGEDDRLRLVDLADAHRDGLARHVVDRREPAFPHLLFAAILIEVDDDIGCLGVEVSGRVVEGEMTVFADAGETYVDGMGLDLFVERLADFFGGAALGFDLEGIF